MIETEQTVVVDAGIEGVWDYVQDMRRWAALMPGMREFEVIDDNDSRWILKVGVGGLVRTVKVLVHVDRWAGPDAVDFTYKLEGDPVQGGGSYRAAKKGPNQTEIVLRVQVVGGGPMAPMWEAMGAPLLPQLAKGFAGQLKAAIEEAAPAPAPQAEAAPARRSLWAALAAWLRGLFAGRPTAGERAAEEKR
jgi:carbon monoxide dehydrogenase subunit G